MHPIKCARLLRGTETLFDNCPAKKQKNLVHLASVCVILDETVMVWVSFMYFLKLTGALISFPC